MSKTVVLVGHCGADSSYLRMAVKAAEPAAVMANANSMAELRTLLDQGAALVLFNRLVDYGFDTTEGVDLIRQVHETHPNARLMLVSNYAESQQAAVSAGAMNGFGKRELGTPKVKQLLQQAINGEVPVA